MTQEEILKTLQSKGITCSSCWWREGDRCYYGEPERETGEEEGGERGRSKVYAKEVCVNHSHKRSVLEQFLPTNMLKIVSEENNKAKGGDGINY